MFDGLRDLMIEQSSPTEVIIFILVGVLACMVLAFLAYVVIMLVLWGAYLRKDVRLSRVFLPSSQQIREYFGEYALAVSTSALLSLTVMAKHDLVQRILAYDLGAIAAELSVPLLNAEEAEVGATILSAIVKPAITSGASEQATLLIKEVVLPRLERRGLARFITERNLVLCCVVLSILYLIWLAWRRSREPSEDPEYGRTLRGVFVLAVCVTLLLASPSLMADEQLAESAVAKLQRSAAADDDDLPLVVRAERQRDLLKDVRAFSDGRIEDDTPDAQTSALRAEVERLRSTVESCEQRCQEMTSNWLALEEAVANVGTSLANHESDFQNAIAELTARDDGLMDAHARDLERLPVGRLEEKIGALESMHNALEQRHEREIAELMRRTEADNAKTGIVIVHAGFGVSYTLGRGRYTGPRCLTLSPGTLSIQARGQNVLGPDGNPIGEIRIQAGVVTAVWITPQRPSRRGSASTPERRVPPREAERCADLVVAAIEDPQWDALNKESIIVAEIRNTGNDTAPASLARVVDPSTQQPTGASHNDVARVESLAPGAMATVTFRLSYWVYNPDAHLEVTADYKGAVDECNEDNNTRQFKANG